MKTVMHFIVVRPVVLVVSAFVAVTTPLGEGYGRRRRDRLRTIGDNVYELGQKWESRAK